MNNIQTIDLLDLQQKSKMEQIAELDCNGNLLAEIAEHYKPTTYSNEKINKNVFYSFENATVNEFRYLIKPRKDEDEPVKLIYTHNVFGRKNKSLINSKEISVLQDEIIIKKLNHEKNVKYTYEYTFDQNGKILKARRIFGNINPSTVKNSQTELFNKFKPI